MVGDQVHVMSDFTEAAWLYGVVITWVCDFHVPTQTFILLSSGATLGTCKLSLAGQGASCNDREIKPS